MCGTKNCLFLNIYQKQLEANICISPNGVGRFFSQLSFVDSLADLINLSVLKGQEQGPQSPAGFDEQAATPIFIQFWNTKGFYTT